MVAAIGLAISPVSALAIPFDDLVDPSPNITIDVAHPYSFQHAIDGFSAGDVVNNALLSIVLSDSGGPEGIRYNFDGSSYSQNNTGNAAQTYKFDLDALGITASLSDGVLNVTLSAASGSYIFNSSRLTGDFTVATAAGTGAEGGAVPEPMSLMLLGGGLFLLGSALGLFGLARRPA
jgi:hypothetical protein